MKMKLIGIARILYTKIIIQLPWLLNAKNNSSLKFTTYFLIESSDTCPSFNPETFFNTINGLDLSRMNESPENILKKFITL